MEPTSDGAWVEFSFPSDASYVEMMADVGPSVAETLGFGCGTAEAMTQALLEAVANAVCHGNDCDPRKRVTVQFRREEQALSVSVEDEGPGFVPACMPTGPGQPLRECGRGLFIMSTYADHVEFHRTAGGGTRVVLVKTETPCVVAGRSA